MNISLSKDCNTVGQVQYHPELLTSHCPDRFNSINHTQIDLLKEEPPNSVDVAIIGCGAHGASIACRLLEDYGKEVRVIILDDQEKVMGSFFNRTKEIHQASMRSNYVQHIAPDGFLSLLDFARLHWDKLTTAEKQQVTLALKGDRSLVPTDLFFAHSFLTCRAYGIDKIAFRANVSKIDKPSLIDAFELSTSHGKIFSKVVINCTGGKKRGDLHKDNVESGLQDNRALVVGRGMTSAHHVLELLSNGCHVTWKVGGDMVFQCADCLTKYFRTEGISSFSKASLETRTKIIQESTGTVMPEFLEIFDLYINNNRLSIVSDEEDGNMSFGKIIVSRGYVASVDCYPQKAKFNNNFPVLDQTLELEGYRGFFVSGLGASLEMGPAAKLIDGARIAYEKMANKLDLPDYP